MINGEAAFCYLLGICEHCGKVLDYAELYAKTGQPDDSWDCPYADCRSRLTYKTWGYELVNGKYDKVLYVGPEGKWVDSCPSEHFKLGDLQVYV